MNAWLAGILGVVIGALIGGLIAWLIAMARRANIDAGRLAANERADAVQAQVDELRHALDAEKQTREQIDDRREAAERTIAELTQQLNAARERANELAKTDAERERRFRETFSALSTDVLQANTKQFLELAQKRFEMLLADAKGDHEKKQQAIDGLIKPIREALEKQQTTLVELERKREVAYKGVEEQIRHIAASHEKLNSETNRLVTALRRPEQRGRWGELQLRNVVELAGMTAHCDFTEQTSSDDGRSRPDMIVRLPGGGQIIIDSKVALDAYLDGTQVDADRAQAMQRHTDHMANHVRQLSSRKYWDQFERTPRLVVMFVPLESALSAALDIRPTMHADAMEQNVLIATPTLLVALLRAVAFGWQQEDVAANAREIASVGRELYDRIGTFAGHLSSVGTNIERAASAYNKSVASLETRVLPSTRRLKELNVTSEEHDEPRPVDVTPRPITADELRTETTRMLEDHTTTLDDD